MLDLAGAELLQREQVHARHTHMLAQFVVAFVVVDRVAASRALVVTFSLAPGEHFTHELVHCMLSVVLVFFEISLSYL